MTGCSDKEERRVILGRNYNCLQNSPTRSSLPASGKKKENSLAFAWFTICTGLLDFKTFASTSSLGVLVTLGEHGNSFHLRLSLPLRTSASRLS